MSGWPPSRMPGTTWVREQVVPPSVCPSVRGLVSPACPSGHWWVLLGIPGPVTCPLCGWARGQCALVPSYRTLATEHEALMQKYLHLLQIVETEKTVARQLRQQIEDGEIEIERLKAEVGVHRQAGHLDSHRT